jgi:thiamine-phosphate pyrophosphorylase
MMELFVITSSKNSPTEPEIVTKMFEAGLRTLHLRKPKYSTRRLAEYIDKIPVHFHNRIIIHSHHNLFFKYNLKGVHFTAIHLEKKFQRWWFFRRLRLRGKKAILTRTYRKLSEVYTIEEIPFDYYFLGTIFNSLNNELYSGYYDQGLNAALKTAGKTFIARGGINEATIEKAYRMGFKGVALNSILWNAEKPFEKYVEILNFCHQKEIKVD